MLRSDPDIQGSRRGGLATGVFPGRRRAPRNRGIGLNEVLITIAIIGVIAAIASPIVGKIWENANEAKTKQNAKQIETMSAQLAGLGVAHVIPESMGGVAATVRLLREGIIIPSGPMAGSPFRIPHIADEEIENVEEYLRIVYDYSELRLEFHDPEDTGGASGPIFYSQSP